MLYRWKYSGNKVTRKGLDGEVTDEAKDEVLVRANGVPTYCGGHRLSLQQICDPRLLPVPSTCGARTITAM